MIDIEFGVCYITTMKKILKKFVIIMGVALMLVPFVFGAAFAYQPFGRIFFSVFFGSSYVQVGQARLYQAGKVTCLPVFKAENKPFLLIGPYSFGDYEDFFFVNTSQLIGTATDKGGDLWCKVGTVLFIFDDLTSHDSVRMPWHDYLQNKDSSLYYDTSRRVYIYAFKQGNQPEMLKLFIPEKFFTPDMLNAHSVLNQ